MFLLNPKHNSNETAQTIRIYTIAMGYVKGEFSPGNSIAYRLWERQRYLESHQEFDLLLQAKLRDNNPVRARSLATMDYDSKIAAKVQPQAPAEPLPPGNIPGAVAEILQRGARWMSLVIAAGSIILLLDQGQQILVDYDDTIGDVIEVGTDELFEAMKGCPHGSCLYCLEGYLSAPLRCLYDGSGHGRYGSRFTCEAAPLKSDSFAHPGSTW